MNSSAKYWSARLAHPSGASFVRATDERTVAVVCDDHQLRRRLCIAFDREDGFALVASSPTTAEAARPIESAQPDVVAVALTATAMADPDLVERLHERARGASLVFHLPRTEFPDGQSDAWTSDASVASVAAAVRGLVRPPTVAFDLDADAESPERARRLIAGHCDELGTAADQHALELVAGELVTNAIVHGAGPITVAVETRPTAVRVEVTGRSQALPRLRSAAGPAATGGGLAVVGAVSCAWGVRSAEVAGSKTVWAEVDGVPTRRAPRPLVDPGVGTPVEVQNRFVGSWTSGFTMAAADDIGLVVRRDSDGSVLPPISRARVRPVLDHPIRRT